MILPIGDIADAIAKGTEGRSEGFIMMIGAVGIMIFLYWRDSKSKELEAASRLDDVKHTREILSKFADGLDVIGKAATTTAQAIEQVAENGQKMEQLQASENKAFLLLLDSFEANVKGDKETAQKRIEDVRAVLLNVRKQD